MDMLDPTRLRTFVTIAQEGSFTRAAAQLNLTQPTVSQQMAVLERELGAELLVRGSRQLHLTAAGQALLPYAERLLELNAEALRNAREAAGLADRTLRIGVGHTLAIYLLPNILRRLRDLEPAATVRIHAGNTADLLTAAADGMVDMALVGSPAAHPQLQITPFMYDRLVVIVSPNDPWQQRSHITLTELRQRTLLTREKGSALHASVQVLLGSEHLAGRQVITLGETEAIKRSVEAGLGVALIQGIAIEREVMQGILHRLTVSEGPTRRTYNIALRVDTQLSPLGQQVQMLLLKQGQTSTIDPA